MYDTFDPHRHLGPMPSPCISLCVMDPDTDLCQGCQRSIEEIIGWSSADEAKKRAVWIAILARRSVA